MLATIILDALPAEMYSTVKLEAIQDPDLSLEQIQRMMRNIFNHLKRVPVTKNNQESKMYQQSNHRGREHVRECSDVNCFYHLSLLQKTRSQSKGLQKKTGERIQDEKVRIFHQEKSGVDNINLTVIRISSVSSK